MPSPSVSVAVGSPGLLTSSSIVGTVSLSSSVSR